MTWNPFKRTRQPEGNDVYPEQGSDRFRRSLEKFEQVLEDIDKMLANKKDCEKDNVKKSSSVHH